MGWIPRLAEVQKCRRNKRLLSKIKKKGSIFIRMREIVLSILRREFISMDVIFWYYFIDQSEPHGEEFSWKKLLITYQKKIARWLLNIQPLVTSTWKADHCDQQGSTLFSTLSFLPRSLGNRFARKLNFTRLTTTLSSNNKSKKLWKNLFLNLFTSAC